MIGIIGATGRLGRLVLTHLTRHGVDPASVRAFGRDHEKLLDVAARGFATIAIDLGDPATLADRFSGVQTLLLIASNDVERRVSHHEAVIDAALTAGVSQIVYTSVLHADTSALPVAADHRRTEELLRESGLTLTLLRNGWFTESFAREFHQARESGSIVNSIGRVARINSAARTDYAAAAAAVLVDPARYADAVLELAGDSAWTFGAFADVASEALGRRVSYSEVSDEAQLDLLRTIGMGDDAATRAVALNDAIRQGALEEPGRALSRLLGRSTTRLSDAFRLWV